MAKTDFSGFEQWARDQLANGPRAYEDLHAAARLEGYERHLSHLRTMAANGQVKFKLTVQNGERQHTVQLAEPELPF